MRRGMTPKQKYRKMNAVMAERRQQRHEILMNVIDPDWREKEAESAERQQLLAGFVKASSRLILDDFGQQVWRAFWHEHICASETPGYYDLPFETQKEIISLIDRVGVEKFFSVFVEEGFDLDATMATFAPEWALDEGGVEYRLRQQELVREVEG